MPNAPMPLPAEPNLDSFVLRFVRSGEPLSDASAAQRVGNVPDGREATNWHGVIRHVQSNRERVFSRWADAVAFISEFVDVREHGVREHGVREHGVREHGVREHGVQEHGVQEHGVQEHGVWENEDD